MNNLEKIKKVLKEKQYVVHNRIIKELEILHCIISNQENNFNIKGFAIELNKDGFMNIWDVSEQIPDKKIFKKMNELLNYIYKNYPIFE